MKIVYFSTDNSRASGAFRALVQLSKDLVKKGNDVFVILPYNGNGTALLDENHINHQMIYQFSWIRNIRFNIWDYISHYLFIPNNIIAKARIKTFLTKFNPDIAIINTVYSYCGAEVCKKMNIPYVWCIKEAIWKHARKDFFNIHKSIDLFNGSASIVAASKSVMEQYVGIFDDQKLTYIYEGVDVDYYLNRNHTIFKDKAIHFINTGRINNSKSQYQIIKALNKLPNHIDFDLTLVGKSSAEYKQELLKICNFKDRLFIKGEVGDVRPYLAKADIFINPSIGEAFGLTTLEAGLAGCYLIGAKMMGTEEIIGQENGLLFEPNDINDLYEKIMMAINNKEKIINIVKASQDRLSIKFSNKINCEKFEFLLKNLL